MAGKSAGQKRAGVNWPLRLTPGGLPAPPPGFRWQASPIKPRGFDPGPHTEIDRPDIHWLRGARDHAALPLTPEGDLVLELVPGQRASLTIDHDTRVVEMEV